MAYGLNVCKPVTSAPKAKLPLPTCNGVTSELCVRRTLNDWTTFWRWPTDTASAREESTKKTDRTRIVVVVTMSWGTFPRSHSSAERSSGRVIYCWASSNHRHVHVPPAEYQVPHIHPSMAYSADPLAWERGVVVVPNKAKMVISRCRVGSFPPVSVSAGFARVDEVNCSGIDGPTVTKGQAGSVQDARVGVSDGRLRVGDAVGGVLSESVQVVISRLQVAGKIGAVLNGYYAISN